MRSCLMCSSLLSWMTTLTACMLMHTSSGSWGKWAVFEDCQVILVALKEGDRVWVSSSPLIPLNLVCFFDAVSCLLVYSTLFWQWICLLWGLRWWWWTGHIFWVSTPCSKSYMHPFPTCSGGPTPFMMIGIMPLPACSHGAPLPCNSMAQLASLGTPLIPPSQAVLFWRPLLAL